MKVRVFLALLVSICCACTSPGAAPPSANDLPAGGGISADKVRDGGQDATACMVMAQTECPDPPLHFADVQPLINTWCVVCHDETSTDGGPWPLTDYQRVAAWADLVRSDVLDCSMPPPDAGAPVMPIEDREAILRWVRCGYLR